MGLAMGVNNLVDIFWWKYYRHLSGGILEAFGKLFFRDMKVFLYPMLDENGDITTSENLKFTLEWKSYTNSLSSTVK
jgi:hypothetical protein